MHYAGIGSRSTPDEILEDMEDIASNLAEEGWTLRSGGADGADTAFEDGCDVLGGKKEIFLPWSGFNQNRSFLHPSRMNQKVWANALEMAKKYHPAGDNLKDAALKLMGRNSFQVMGTSLCDPVKFVVAYAPGGFHGGGTSQALRIARAHDIPIVNFYDRGHRQVMKAIEEQYNIEIF